MSDRVYLFLIGLCILIALYLEVEIILFAVVIVMLFEGISGWTLPLVVQKTRGIKLDSGLLQYMKPARFNFAAFRLLRISLATVVFLSYIAVHEYNVEMLWFFPWFVGFAVLGAGVSGVCPVYLAIRWLGFK